MIVTIFDYGAGNLHSLAKALAGPSRTVRLERDPRAAVRTDVLVLPGVGAFGPAADALAPGRAAMRDAIYAGLPCLGVCLGMQLLFDSSEEGTGEGLGVFAGRVTRLVAERVPHIGWNTLDDATDPLLTSSGLTTVCYANAFVCRTASTNEVVAWSTHESDRFPAAMRRGSLFGVQFHPEKSSAQGVRFLSAFLDAVAR